MEEVFCQTFTAVLPGLGQHTEVALVAGGDTVMVTEDNRRQYVDAYVDCVLNRAVDLQFEVWPAGLVVASRFGLMQATSCLPCRILHQKSLRCEALTCRMAESGGSIALLSLLPHIDRFFWKCFFSRLWNSRRV